MSEIYIHIPFCVRKCLYCDFNSSVYGEKEREEYLQALLREIAVSPDMGRIDTVFFGGGTPSLVRPEYIKSILEEIRGHFDLAVDAEISIEVNPGTADENKLYKYLEYGINRISIGVQSLIDEELMKIGRIHNGEMAEECIRAAKRAGFKNINADIMSALPGQSPESLGNTLDRITDLDLQHISVYSLILEENTALYESVRRGELKLLSEDEEIKLDELVREKLSGAGYKRYEISNYAKTGYECGIILATGKECPTGALAWRQPPLTAGAVLPQKEVCRITLPVRIWLWVTEKKLRNTAACQKGKLWRSLSSWD